MLPGISVRLIPGHVPYQQAVVVSDDLDVVRRRAHWHLEIYTGLPNYRESWRRQGFAEPDWVRGGSELLYRTSDSVFAVAVTPGATFRTGVSRALFGGQFRQKNTTNWDASADGQRFVMVRPPAVPADGPPLSVILHWFDQPRAARR